jgi:chromosome partitioning protein
MRTITTANQKGGVGKTTLTCHLAWHLAGIGKRVLCVDIDPQGDLTTYLVKELPEESHVRLLFEEKEPRPCVVSPFLSIIGSNRRLSRWEADTKWENFQLLVGLVKKYQKSGEYDYMLIDTPPSLALFTTNAFLAADDILVPVDVGEFSIMGLTELFKSIDKIHERRDSELPKILGIVLENVQERLVLTQTVRAQLDKEYNGLVFDTSIPTSVRIPEGVYVREPVSRGKARDAFVSLFVEMDRRLA